jgi:hypothetical protein
MTPAVVRKPRSVYCGAPMFRKRANGRCAVSGLPDSLLLDAAHIIADEHEKSGRPRLHVSDASKIILIVIGWP